MKIKTSKTVLPILIMTVWLLSGGNAHAMHISEGILPFNWAVLWFAAAMPFVAYGIKRLKELSKTDLSIKPLVGLMAAIVFIISCMPTSKLMLSLNEKPSYSLVN